MSKKLTRLIIHCTATPEGREVTKKDIEQWHYVERGWSKLGYSDMIHLDGRLENLTPFNQDDTVDYNEMTWGVSGLNGISRHIVYVGGLDKKRKAKNTLNDKQKKTLLDYLRYTILRHPKIKIAGHNQFANKDCPSFKVPSFLINNGIPLKNIFTKS